MIKANEIRVGNWLNDPRQYDPKFFTKTENGYFKATARDIQFAEEFEPIPLTEEILLKCKFQELNEFENTCIDKDNFIEISSVLEDEFYIGKNKETGFYHFLTIDTFQGDDLFFKSISAPMQYLHTLQNYYPAFSGQELEINL